MYKFLIRKLRRDTTLTEEEFTRRRLRIIAFWGNEGQKFERLIEKINEEDEDNLSFDNAFLSLGYWFRFKLLCEGKEPTFENVVLNGLDAYALKLFINEIQSIMNN